MTKESEGVTNHSTPLQSEQRNQLHLTNQITLIKFLRKKLWAGKSGMQQIHVVKLNTKKKIFASVYICQCIFFVHLHFTTIISWCKIYISDFCHFKV